MDFWGNLFVVLAAFSLCCAALVLLYGLLCQVPDEVMERIAERLWGR